MSASPKIYAIGETVFDVIFKQGHPVAGRPGGAMLNTAVSLGRLGLPVSFISEMGKDDLGTMVIEFLKDNEVDTRFIYRYSEGNTALAIAMIGRDEEASYTFYKKYPSRRLEVPFPTIRRNDILVFGSFYAIDSKIRIKLTELLRKASKAGAIILYDPNFRKPHLKDLPKLSGFIHENFSFSDIVRGSADDFRNILNAHHANDTFQILSGMGCGVVIITDAANPVMLRSGRKSVVAEVPPTNILSTIGAGDSFNAGLIYSLYKLGISKTDILSLKKQEWETILETAVTFGCKVCESYDNYISRDFASRLRMDARRRDKHRRL